MSENESDSAYLPDFDYSDEDYNQVEGILQRSYNLRSSGNVSTIQKDSQLNFNTPTGDVETMEDFRDD